MSSKNYEHLEATDLRVSIKIEQHNLQKVRKSEPEHDNSMENKIIFSVGLIFFQYDSVMQS